MHALNLFAYVLVISIYPVMAEIAVTAGGINPLVLAFSQVMSLCAFGFCATASWKNLSKSLRDVTARKKRRPFMALVIFSIFTCLCSSFAFQGSGQEGTGAIANLVDVVGTVIFAVLTAPYFERLLGKPLPAKRRAWVPLSVALVAVSGFVIDQRAGMLNDGHILNCFAQPEVAFAGLWALCGVMSMNITRVYFSTDATIKPSGFMAWRYLIPSVCMGVLLARESSHGSLLWRDGGEAAIGVISLGLSLVLAIWFQYRALQEYSSDTIARAQMLVPFVTYVVALTAKRAMFSWPSLALASAVAGCLWLTRATKYAKDEHTPGLASVFWNRWIGAKYGLYQSLLNARFFIPGLLGFGCTGLILLPVVSALASSSGYVYFTIFTMPATALVLTLALVSGSLDTFLRRQLIGGVRTVLATLSHEMQAPIHLAHTAVQLAQLDPHDELALSRARRAVDLSSQVARALMRGVIDDASVSSPILLNKNVRNVRDSLQEMRTIITSSLLEDKQQRLNVENAGMEHQTFHVDQTRLFLVFYNLTRNAIQAWRREHGPNIDELRIVWRADVTPSQGLEEESSLLRITVEDNGPGGRFFSDGDALESWLVAPDSAGHFGWRLCKEYLESHNGRFTVLKKPDSTGLVAALEIPLTDPQEMRHHASQKAFCSSSRQ